MKYLITGASGFIGKRIVRDLLLKTPEASLYLIIRPPSFNRTQEKFKNEPRITIIKGDLEKNDIVSRVKDFDFIKNEIDVIIHIAGHYTLNASEEESYMSNVVGTQNMIFLADQCVKLKHFHYLSSYCVADSTKEVAFEDDLNEQALFDDFYARSKHQAESLVRNHHWNQCSVRIYRPGIVVGDSQTGEVEKVDGPYYFFRLLKKHQSWLKWIPQIYLPTQYNPEASLPLIPLNTLSSWIVEMITRPTHHPLRTYHVFSDEHISFKQALELSSQELKISLKVLNLPRVNFLNPLWHKTLETVNIPKEILHYLQLQIKWSFSNLKQDYPHFKAPPLKSYIPQLVHGYLRSHL
jgi:thioester reductase-like protein